MILAVFLSAVAIASALPTDLLKEATQPKDESTIPIYKPGFNPINFNMLGHEYGRYFDEFNKNFYPYQPNYFGDNSPFAYKYNYFSKYFQPNYEQALYQLYLNSYKQQEDDFFQQNTSPYSLFDYFKQQYMRQHFPINFRYPSQYPFQYNYGRFDESKIRPFFHNSYYYNMKPYQFEYNYPQYYNKAQLKLKDFKINPELDENVNDLREAGIIPVDALQKNVHDLPLIVQTEKVYYKNPLQQYQPTLTTNYK